MERDGKMLPSYCSWIHLTHASYGPQIKTIQLLQMHMKVQSNYKYKTGWAFWHPKNLP